MCRFSFAVLAIILISISGCGDEAQTTVSPNPTPAEQFDDTHGGKTVLTDGRVVEGSAEDMPDGSIEFDTEDGRRFRVEPQPDGRLGTPERVD